MKSLLMMIAICTISQISEARELVITVTGDTNFTQSYHIVGRGAFHPDRASKHGNWFTWEETTQYVEPFFDNSDLTFTNVETVVTWDINRVQARSGLQFVFASHINGFRHLIEEVDFNMFALSNNHINDFGQQGMNDTLESFEILQSENPEIAFSGLAPAATVYEPVIFEHQGQTLAFASVNGVGYFPEPSDQPSQVSYNNSQYERLLDNMAQVQADLKILSIHAGRESRAHLDHGQRERFRMAVDRGDVDIVIGHHPHVVRPVEIYNEAVIFYSLGNFLMFGAANIDGRSDALNYGGIGKVHLNLNGNIPEIMAVEMIPIRQMHQQPIPLEGLDGQRRMEALNSITRSDLPETGIQFGVTDWGTGLSCFNPRPGTQAQRICSGGSPLP